MVAAMLWQFLNINRFKEDVHTAFRQAGKTANDLALDSGNAFWRFAILAMNTRILEPAFRIDSLQYRLPEMLSRRVGKRYTTFIQS
jgi:hypothetical protein